MRILRLARFAARFADFTVAPETAGADARRWCDAGEVDALVPERVWQELARGLMEARPSRMFEVLRDCGALARLLPEVDRLWGVPQRAEYHPEVDTGVHLMMVLDMARAAGRAAAGALRLPGATTWARARRRPTCCRATSATRSAARGCCTALCERLRVPTDCRELADVVAREHGNIHRSGELGAAAAGAPAGALRRAAPAASASPRCCWPASATRAAGWASRRRPYPQRAAPGRARCARRWRWTPRRWPQAAAARGLTGPAIGEAVREARVRAIADALAASLIGR